MRKSKEVAEELFKKITDPDDLKLVGEYEASQKEEEAHIKKIEENNVKLSMLAQDALINGAAGQPKPNEPPIPPATGQTHLTFEEIIADYIKKKETKQ